MANGQEVFQKVLQIHIMFPEYKRALSNLRFIREKRAGGVVQTDSSLFSRYPRRIKTTGFPAKISVI